MTSNAHDARVPRPKDAPMTARVERVHSALVLVDFQARLMPTIHDARRLADEAGFLADVARRLGLRVIGTEQNPRSLGHSVPEIREHCDAIVAKVHFDGCLDGLIDALRRHSAPPRGSFEH
ncbi:MAG: isochorismatase family protein, partial [Casimicrobiaceae bacterium]